MVGNCTKGGLKGKVTQVNEGRVQVILNLVTQVNEGRVQGILYLVTQVNEGRVQVILYLLTQVSEDRVQVICKLSTQVNKGRVQVRIGTRVNEDRVHSSTRKTSFQNWEALNKNIQVLQPEKHTAQPRKPVFQVGSGNIGQDTAKYQVSSTKERPGKLVFQVVKEGQGNFIEKPAGHFDESTIQEISFPGRTGKKNEPNKKNLWMTTGIENSSSIWKNGRASVKKGIYKTSRTGCDYQYWR